MKTAPMGLERHSNRSGLDALRERAARKVLDAMAAEPFFVEDTGGFVTDFMTVASGSVRLKSGAEGVSAAALPGFGYAVAIKIEDGSMRAAELVMASLLDALGCLDVSGTCSNCGCTRPSLARLAAWSDTPV